MKIFGICVVKNEADIVRETLPAAATWCDRILIEDNGSDDGTWKILQELARKHEQIVPWRQNARTFHGSHRGDIFRQFRSQAANGDWWTRLDADEAYIDEPRSFLASVPPQHHVVAAAQFQYYLTERDLMAGPGGGRVADHSGGIAGRLHFYRCEYAETRFFRHRSQLVWPEEASWPTHMGVVHPRLIRNRHLQYRSPEQIQKRIDVRLKAIEEGCGTFQHVRDKRSWRDLIVDSSTCLDDRDPNPWQIDYSKLPRFTEKPLHRLIKHVMHGTGMWA
jgi:glycosyltransferase involved in cell wall biosynthesis